MDWKKYEKEICDCFMQAYPDAEIYYNQKIKGRYSKVDRQVDVLIEGHIAGKLVRIVIDGKQYSQKINVKHVESFISMVDDLNAVQGILITSRGYSKAAINRAYFGPTDIELDILSFEDLKKFQGFGGIMYSGWHGTIMPAPFGWIVDATRRHGSIATLYQRGKTYDEAVKAGEFIYVNIFSYDDEVSNLDDVIKLHELDTLKFHPKATFDYTNTIKRKDGNTTRLRKIIRTETKLHEYTGFVGFDKFCVFGVLFTTEELKNKNIRKLEYCIERLIPMNVDLNSVADTEINSCEILLEKTKDPEEKAGILIRIAEINRDMNRLDKAIDKYKESVETFPNNYNALLGILEIDFMSSNRDNLIDNFYNLSPGNRQICDDIVRICLQYNRTDFLEEYLLKKTTEIIGDSEKLGNIYFSLADFFYSIDKKGKALSYFKLSKENFTECFKKNHPAIISINCAIKELEI